MADLAANVLGMSHQGNVTIIAFPAEAAGTFYKGQCVCLETTGGKLSLGGFSAHDIFVGFCAEYKVVAAADEEVAVAINGVWTFTNGNVAIAEAGDPIYFDASADSNNPADLDSATGITEADGDSPVGMLLRVFSSGQITVDLGNRLNGAGTGAVKYNYT